MKCVATTFLLSTFAALPVFAEEAKGKFSFVMFSDFYSVLRHNVSGIEGKNGFWVRRIYLTYDHKVDDKLSAQFRLEAKDPGDFSTSSNLEPFVKDAWIRWTESGHKITFGLIPTPTTAPAEDKLGYRAIEKTPLDLYKLGSTRDKGISIQGPLGAGGKAEYMVMFGDGSGTKSSDGETKTLYGRIGYKLNESWSADVYADCWDKADGEEWKTVKGEVFFRNSRFKAGAMAAKQNRSYSKGEDLNLDIFSLYGEFRANERWSPFVRLDVLGDPVPGADKIEFWHMADDGKPTLVMVGARCRLHESLELIPSYTSIRYRGGASGNDAVFRLTLSAKL